MPFANNFERALHFQKHGHEFGASTEIDYEQMADAFMFGILAPPAQECTRPNRVDRLRFNNSNRNFGVAHVRPEFLRTFYRVSSIKIARHGGGAAFFGYECARMNL